jgi:hypothetical protein
MSSALESIADYEDLVYRLPEAFPCIQMSTLVVVHTGPVTAVVKGEILFGQGLLLRVVEVVDTHQQRIGSYGCELWQGHEELWGYDSWPHPDDPSLAVSHPHHQHVPPDIKRHRIPAPELSFSSPNLPFLIQKTEREHLKAE